MADRVARERLKQQAFAAEQHLADKPAVFTPHGFSLLFHEDAGRRHDEGRRLYELLLDAGFGPWDQNGLPLFVVLDGMGTKQLWFEAGYLAGAKVPLFAVGKGVNFRQRHLATLGRLGGWAVSIEGDDLVARIAARGLAPTSWDIHANAVARAKFALRAAENGASPNNV